MQYLEIIYQFLFIIIGGAVLLAVSFVALNYFYKSLRAKHIKVGDKLFYIHTDELGEEYITNTSGNRVKKVYIGSRTDLKDIRGNYYRISKESLPFILYLDPDTGQPIKSKGTQSHNNSPKAI